MAKKMFVTNCEGPISKNNNAKDLLAHFVPEGKRIYDILVSYSYITAYITRKNKNYKFADTSKLFLPFLLAFDANNKNVEEACESNLVLSKNSKNGLSYITQLSEPFILSSSYEHNTRAICKETSFPLENVYCTKANLEKFELSSKEKTKIKSFAWEIGCMSPPQIPTHSHSIKDLSSKDQATANRLDKIFWNEITKTRCKRIFSDLRIIDEASKTEIIQHVLGQTSSSLENMMYVGSDRTDAAAMQLIKNNGGFTVSFNGDQDTLRFANASIVSDNFAPVSVLADLFCRFGKVEALRVSGNFEKNVLWLTKVDQVLLNRLFDMEATGWPKVKIVTDWNYDAIVNEITAVKKSVL